MYKYIISTLGLKSNFEISRPVRNKVNTFTISNTYYQYLLVVTYYSSSTTSSYLSKHKETHLVLACLIQHHYNITKQFKLGIRIDTLHAITMYLPGTCTTDFKEVQVLVGSYRYIHTRVHKLMKTSNHYRCPLCKYKSNCFVRKVLVCVNT